MTESSTVLFMDDARYFGVQQLKHYVRMSKVVFEVFKYSIPG